MRLKYYFIIGLLPLILLLSSCSSGPGKYDAFAQCLTENGVKMYGAYWCPHCLNQKEDFGKSWQYVNYIECSLPGNQGQTEICATAGITTPVGGSSSLYSQPDEWLQFNRECFGIIFV
ncbi:hypothetical protein HYU22_05320 [Candidatus Woesearchaeota archaeon]|nr:hypothetical protein [Candidatus Woesearchaeota archaeon]